MKNCFDNKFMSWIMENCLHKIWPTYARSKLHDSTALFTEIEVTLWYFRVEKVLVIPSQQLVFFQNLLMPNSSYVEHFTCTSDSLVSRRVLIIDGFENNSPLRIQFVKFSVLGTDWIFAPLLSGQTGRDHCILILCWVSLLWSSDQTSKLATDSWSPDWFVVTADGWARI